MTPTEELKRIVRNLVDSIAADPENVMVLARWEGDLVRVHVFAPDEDLGHLIGKKGQMATALRTVVVRAAVKLAVRCELNVGPYVVAKERQHVHLPVA